MSTKVKPLEDYLTEKEAATFAGYSVQSIRNFRREGRIEWTSTATGRKVKIKKTSLLKFLGY